MIKSCTYVDNQRCAENKYERDIEVQARDKLTP
jgi:hypothetical protein